MQTISSTEFNVEVSRYLREHHTVTLSTSSFTGLPHANTASYVSDDRRMYFFARYGSTLLSNLARSHRAAFTVDRLRPDLAKAQRAARKRHLRHRRRPAVPGRTKALHGEVRELSSSRHHLLVGALGHVLRRLYDLRGESQPHPNRCAPWDSNPEPADQDKVGCWAWERQPRSAAGGLVVLHRCRRRSSAQPVIRTQIKKVTFVSYS